MKKPPTSGPAMAERPKRAPIGPMYLARSRAGTMSAMIACDRIIRPPPPRPWTPRQTTSQPKSGASAAPMLATVNRPIAIRNSVPAAPQVAELAVDGHDEGGGQQVGRGHPRHVGDAAEVADDGGHRRGHDGLVQGGHEHAGEQRREDQVDPAPGEDDRGRAGLGCGLRGGGEQLHSSWEGRRRGRGAGRAAGALGGSGAADGVRSGQRGGAGRPAVSRSQASSTRSGRAAVKSLASQRCRAVRMATPATPASSVG